MQKVGIHLYLLLSLQAFAFANPDPCLSILTKLAPLPPSLIFSIKAYAQVQQDITGESRYTAPTHAGIKLEVPLLDTREKWEMRRTQLNKLKEASQLLSRYLTLRAEVEEGRKYLKWQWQRVEEGIEYRRDIWKEEIKLKTKEAELKALTSLMLASGIHQEELNRCYEGKSR